SSRPWHSCASRRWCSLSSTSCRRSPAAARPQHLPPKATTFIAEETLTGNCPAAFPRSRSCLSASASVSVRPLASLFILETIVCGGDFLFPCCPNLVGLRWGGRLLQEAAAGHSPFWVVSARELISRPSFLWRFPRSRPER